jgi:hypothetical protein
MAEWRDILDRAADNLSVDHNRGPQASFRQQPAGWPAQQRGSRDVPFVASRDLLARELEAVSSPVQARRAPQTSRMQASQRMAQAPAAARAPITQSIGAPVPALRSQPPQQRQQPAAQRSSSGRELAALSVSVGIVVLTVYGFFVLLH